MNILKKENIKEAIDKWDPIDLLPFAPSDEYDYEIKKIYDITKDIENIDINYLGQIIYNVFEKAFGDNVFLKNINECKEVASEIIKLTNKL